MTRGATASLILAPYPYVMSRLCMDVRNKPAVPVCQRPQASFLSGWQCELRNLKAARAARSNASPSRVKSRRKQRPACSTAHSLEAVRGMPDVAGADAFLADLLDGLDDSAFSSPTASGSFRPKQPATTTPAQTHSQPRKRLKVAQSVTAKLASSPSFRVHPSPSPLGPGTSPAPSTLLAIPPTPQPFWNDPFARRKLSPAAVVRRDGQPADENKAAELDATPTRAKRSRRHDPLSPVKKGALPAQNHATGRGLDVPAPKRVEIEIDEPQEPKRKALAEKGRNIGAPLPVVTLQAPLSDTSYFDDDFPLDEALWDDAPDTAAAKTSDTAQAKVSFARLRSDVVVCSADICSASSL